MNKKQLNIGRNFIYTSAHGFFVANNLLESVSQRPVGLISMIHDDGSKYKLQSRAERLLQTHYGLEDNAVDDIVRGGESHENNFAEAEQKEKARRLNLEMASRTAHYALDRKMKSSTINVVLFVEKPPYGVDEEPYIPAALVTTNFPGIPSKETPVTLVYHNGRPIAMAATRKDSTSARSFYDEPIVSQMHEFLVELAGGVLQNTHIPYFDHFVRKERAISVAPAFGLEAVVEPKQIQK